MSEATESINIAMGDIPSRRETLAEALSSMFAVGDSGFLSVLTFALGVISLGWLADSALPLLHDLGNLLLATSIKGKPPQTNFTDSFIKLTIPVLWFIVLVTLLFINRRRNLRPHIYSATVPDPHKGLIVMLSTYSQMRGQEGYASPDEMMQAVAI